MDQGPHGITKYLQGCQCEKCLTEYNLTMVMVGRYRDGESIADISEDVGLSRTAIARRFSLLDVKYMVRGGAHGRAMYEKGCRCDVCVEGHERDLSIANRSIQGESQSDLAREFDVSRERIRQITKHFYPHFRAQQAKRERAEEKKKREWEKKASPCVVCNTLTTRICCGWECYKIRDLLRYHWDEERHEIQRIKTAEWNLKNLGGRDDLTKEEETHLRYAKRILAGEETEDRGQWLVKGSKTFFAGVRLYELGGSLFKELPDQIQDQIIRYVNEVSKPDMVEEDSENILGTNEDS